MLLILRLPPVFFFFFFNDTATTEIYTLSLHDALPISSPARLRLVEAVARRPSGCVGAAAAAAPWESSFAAWASHREPDVADHPAPPQRTRTAAPPRLRRETGISSFRTSPFDGKRVAGNQPCSNSPAAISAEHFLDEQWHFRVSLDALRTADLPRAQYSH